jgi:hypothetical protein
MNGWRVVGAYPRREALLRSKPGLVQLPPRRIFTAVVPSAFTGSRREAHLNLLEKAGLLEAQGARLRTAERAVSGRTSSARASAFTEAFARARARACACACARARARARACARARARACGAKQASP